MHDEWWRCIYVHPRAAEVGMQGVRGREHLHPRPAEVAMQGVRGAALGAGIVQQRACTIPFHASCKRWQGGYTKAPCTANTVPYQSLISVHVPRTDPLRAAAGVATLLRFIASFCGIKPGRPAGESWRCVERRRPCCAPLALLHVTRMRDSDARPASCGAGGRLGSAPSTPDPLACGSRTRSRAASA
jgi:hypothetical protein